MKIGIMTLWWSSNNYGQQLQLYALYKYLSKRGHQPFLIRYKPKEKRFDKSKIMKSFIPSFMLRYFYRKWLKKKKSDVKFDLAFKEFRLNNIKQSEKTYHTLDELRRNPPDAEAYIVGSDVVWKYSDRFFHRINQLHAFFLDFGKQNVKRLAYAASFGRASVTPEFASYIKPLLKKFDAVTVREENGVDICRRAGREDAQIALDPTLLLSEEDYYKIMKPMVETDYMLIYLVNNEHTLPSEELIKYSERNNLKIILIGQNPGIKIAEEVHPKIEEWLGLIAQSKVVITNSYHGMIFSIIFRKQFTVIPLTGKHAKMNARYSSLLEKLDINGKVFTGGNIEDYINNELDYDYIQRNIEKENVMDKLLNSVSV